MERCAYSIAKRDSADPFVLKTLSGIAFLHVDWCFLEISPQNWLTFPPPSTYELKVKKPHTCLSIFMSPYKAMSLTDCTRRTIASWIWNQDLGPFLVLFPTGNPPRLPSVHETQKPSPVDSYGSRKGSMLPHTLSGPRDRVLGPARGHSNASTWPTVVLILCHKNQSKRRYHHNDSCREVRTV